jgi:hypothetical protein
MKMHAKDGPTISLKLEELDGGLREPQGAALRRHAPEHLGQHGASLDRQPKLSPRRTVAGFRLFHEFDPSHRYGSGHDMPAASG